MSTRRRALDLLVAAELAPQELAIEREKSSREGAARADILGALSSLVPQLASIPGALEGAAAKKAAADLDKQDTLSQIENRAASRRNEISESQRKSVESAAKVKAAEAKALAEAEKAKASTKEASAASQKKARDDAVQQTRAALAGDSKTKTGGLSRADLEARAKAVGMTPEQLLQAADLANLDEKNAAAKTKKALAPKPVGGTESPEKALRRRKLELEIAALEGKPAEKAAAAAATEADKAKKSERLTSGEATAVIELKGAQKLLGDLGNLKKSGGKDGAPINTGPLEAIIGWAAGKVGLQSPEWTKFKATAGSQLAEYIKSISGATVSEPERANLLNNVPVPDDDDEEFVAKLEAVNNILKSKLATMRAGYRAAGRDTAIFDDEAEAEADDIFADD